MRRPTKIVTPLLAAAAVSIMTGCRPPQMQRCVDENNNVVDDKFCANQPQTLVSPPSQPGSGSGGGMIFVPQYRYYYGGGGGYGLGSRVYGGGYTPDRDSDYRTSSGGGYHGGGGFFHSITRGGFGAHFGGGGE